MKWKMNYWGIQIPISVKDNPGTIQIQDNCSIHKDTLERLEPWEADRMLGLRLPMTGEMTIEKNYRKKQMENLGHKLYAAPFSPNDAYVVYQCRYKSMVRYCLPVSIFKEEELQEIQQKFIYLLLPKLGINRHAPRAMIFGPRSRGGREIMDLRVEQPIQHLLCNLGHMRRDDSVGKLLRNWRVVSNVPSTHMIIP